MKDKTIHLSEDQLLFSLVDENDLSQDIKSHLWACPSCRQKKTAFELELDRLGERAKAFTPDPKQEPALLLQKSRAFFSRPAIFAAGFALVLIIVLASIIVRFTDSSKQMTARLSSEKEAYLYLVDEIVEEPNLPDLYLDIIAASNNYFDDEFVEFVVPLEDQANSV